MEETTIPINIWDDYPDDGYVPEGRIQETYMYVEEYTLPHDSCKKYLQRVLDYMNGNLQLDGVKVWLKYYDSRTKYPTLDEMYQYERWEVRFEHLTHERREKLVEELRVAELSGDGLPFRIYSES